MKILHCKLSHVTIFFTLTLIGLINDRIFLLTIRQVVLIGLARSKSHHLGYIDHTDLDHCITVNANYQQEQSGF